jgi:hypothetical protein
MPVLKTALKPWTLTLPREKISGEARPPRFYRSQLMPELVVPGESYHAPIGGMTPGAGVRQGLLAAAVNGVPVACTGSIEVLDNDFSAAATLYVGPYSVTSGVDYTVGASEADTATALAAAIDALPGLSSVATLATLTVDGPPGLQGIGYRFRAVYAGDVQNFALTPDDGALSGAEPYIGPPELS